MKVDRCEQVAVCEASATGLVPHRALGVVAACDQHPRVTVPPFAQHRGYEVPGVGEVTVMIGAPNAVGDSLFRLYLPDGTGTQGTEWPVSVGGDPASEVSAWRLLHMVWASVAGGNVPADEARVMLAVSRYAAQQVEVITDRYVRVLGEAAPVGTTVVVEPYHSEDGWVRLYVEIGDTVRNHRVINPTGVNHITARVAALLGVEYSQQRDAVRDEGEIVRKLGLRLHGSTGSLFAASPGDRETDAVIERSTTRRVGESVAQHSSRILGDTRDV